VTGSLRVRQERIEAVSVSSFQSTLHHPVPTFQPGKSTRHSGFDEGAATVAQWRRHHEFGNRNFPTQENRRSRKSTQIYLFVFWPASICVTLRAPLGGRCQALWKGAEEQKKDRSPLLPLFGDRGSDQRQRLGQRQRRFSAAPGIGRSRGAWPPPVSPTAAAAPDWCLGPGRRSQPRSLAESTARS